jgi:subtilisin
MYYYFKLTLVLIFLAYATGCSVHQESVEVNEKRDKHSNTYTYYQSLEGWFLDYIKVSNNKHTGKGVKIGILDTVLPISTQKKIKSYRSFLDQVGVPSTAGLHGEKIIDIINLISPDAEIYYASIADAQGNITEDSFSKGLEWILSQNVDVINMSFGFEKKIDEVDRILNNAPDETILVAAAGNDGLDRLTYPASSKQVIAVGALNYDGTKWYLSNYGSDLTFSLPGVFIKTDRQSEFSEGTSFSAAILSSMVACILEGNPNMNRAEVLKTLKQMSGNTKKNYETGYGTPKF